MQFWSMIKSYPFLFAGGRRQDPKGPRRLSVLPPGGRPQDPGRGCGQEEREAGPWAGAPGVGGDGSGGQAEVRTDGCRGCPEGPQREAATSGQNSSAPSELWNRIFSPWRSRNRNPSGSGSQNKKNKKIRSNFLVKMLLLKLKRQGFEIFFWKLLNFV